MLLQQKFRAFAIGILLMQSSPVAAQSSPPQCKGVDRSSWTNCQGSFSNASGSYIGEFFNGRVSGFGTFRNVNGNVYSGFWRDAKFDGQGTLTYANGSRYVGAWKASNYDGIGTLYGAGGAILQTGRWQGGKLVEAGVQESQKIAQPQQVQPPIQPSLPPRAESSERQDRRVALIIGNSNYSNASPLLNPTNDANLIASTLRERGFETVDVQINLTRERTILALRRFADVADQADWAVVYYSGHGMELGGANYLLPIDVQLKSDRDIELEAIDVGKVQRAIEGAKKFRLLILDACRDNPFASQMRRSSASRSINRGLARIEPEAGTLIAYSAKHGEVALDGEGANSPFVRAFVNRIQQTPPVEVRRLFDLVRDDVLSATNKKQQPFHYGSISGSEDYFFGK